uniref:6-phosphogluconolactonase n=1 Tax=Acidobacterium capsulatum TaxID=33075 RepID=A0A7V4XRQ5_9BACT
MPRPFELEYRVFEDAAALSHAAAQHFVDCARAAVAQRGKARVAISGGSTPKSTFALLADPAQPYRAQMPWDQLEIYWVDERCVPPEDADSNYRMTRETLLDKVPIPASQVFRMEGERDPVEAAARYESVIRGQFRLEGAQGPVFDMLALGMGDDGHTASLFPHTEAIHELGRIVVANHVPQKQTWRITLTWPVIVEARDLFFLIAGKDKADPLQRVLEGPYDPETLPSQLIQPRSGKLLMLLDKTAAANLPAPGPDGVGKMEIAR